MISSSLSLIQGKIINEKIVLLNSFNALTTQQEKEVGK